MLSNAFSLPQIIGYLAFVLGVGSFLQKSDKHFKVWMAGECMAYAVHFFLLGNPTAVASTLVSAGRSVLSIHTRSLRVAWSVVALNIGLGFVFVKHPADALPLIASCIGTLALFRLQGIRMRMALLLGTVLWLANNLIAGSIGGSALEAVVASVNIFTIIRMAYDARRIAAAA